MMVVHERWPVDLQRCSSRFLRGYRMRRSARMCPHYIASLSTNLHAVTDANGRQMSLFIKAGQIGDYIEKAALLDDLREVQWVFADRL
jgi:hypothetical protein